MYSEIEHLLLKPPQHRLKQEIDTLVTLTYQLPYFKQLYNQNEDAGNIHRNCCKMMSLEQCQKSEIVFRQGTYGEKFYIILSGVVLVKVRKGEMGDEEVVRRLRRGDSFGEYALLSKQSRQATIQCATECMFAVLNKQQFQSILQNQQQSKIDAFVEQMHNISLFANQHKNTIRKVHLNSFVHEFEKGQKAISQGEIPQHSFIVQSGEFIIYKEINNKNYKISTIGAGEVIGLVQQYTNQPFQYTILCNSIKAQVIKLIACPALWKVYDENKKELLKQTQTIQNYIEQRIAVDNNYQFKFKQYLLGRHRSNPQLDMNSEESESSSERETKKQNKNININNINNINNNNNINNINNNNNNKQQKINQNLPKQISPRLQHLEFKMNNMIQMKKNQARSTFQSPRSDNNTSPLFHLFMNKNKQYTINTLNDGSHVFKHERNKDQFLPISQSPHILLTENNEQDKSSRSITIQVLSPKYQKSTSSKQVKIKQFSLSCHQTKKNAYMTRKQQ